MHQFKRRQPYLSVQTSIVMAIPEQLDVPPCRFRCRLFKSTGVLVDVGERLLVGPLHVFDFMCQCRRGVRAMCKRRRMIEETHGLDEGLIDGTALWEGYPVGSVEGMDDGSDEGVDEGMPVGGQASGPSISKV